jgi:hypothetical protein
MVAKKASIPPLVYRGQPRGFGAIPSGTIYAGQLLSVVGMGNLTGADYNASTNKVVPIVKPIQAADVTASGVTSGTIYNPIGVALGDAPIQDTYQQLQVGKPLANPTNATQYQITTDTDVRRMAFVKEGEDVQLWLPFEGSAPSGGDYLTLSASVNGAVTTTATPHTDFTVGQVLGYATDSNFNGVTVSGISAYVLTFLEFKYGGST